jgi:hypothetical protein
VGTASSVDGWNTYQLFPSFPTQNRDFIQPSTSSVLLLSTKNSHRSTSLNHSSRLQHRTIDLPTQPRQPVKPTDKAETIRPSPGEAKANLDLVVSANDKSSPHPLSMLTSFNIDVIYRTEQTFPSLSIVCGRILGPMAGIASALRNIC